jgi:uncharacterized protein (TIGR00106 family)
MLIELSIIPIGNNAHTSDELAEVLKMIDESGLPYQLTPSATCLEGTWTEVFPIIQRCHELVRTICPHVVTNIKVEDEEGAQHKLQTNVDSVERKAGRPLRRDKVIEVASEENIFASASG